MRILISNDDGVQSPGIEALVKHLYREHSVVVAAPAGQQSAKAHAITIGQPLFVDEYLPLKETYGIEAYAISGTPADSVKLYLEGILGNNPDEYPDIVISGINNGSNLGTDLLYSGTVGAALEGLVHGIRSIAVSLNYNSAIPFDDVAKAVISKLDVLLDKMDKPGVLNVNFPVNYNDNPQWIWATQGVRDYENAYLPKYSEDGRLYYMVEGYIIDEGNNNLSDVALCNAGNITVTPVTVSMADREALGSKAGSQL